MKYLSLLCGSFLLFLSTQVFGVSAVLEGVLNNCNGTYTALWGYYNPSSTTVTIPYGTQNRIPYIAENVGQPTVFQPGRVRNAFSYVFTSSQVVWHLDFKTSTASQTAATNICSNNVIISAGGRNSALVKSDGTLLVWGSNSYGQIGDGTNTNRYVPTQVMTNVKDVDFGVDEHSVFLKNDGSVWTSGFGLWGALGGGTLTDYDHRRVPQQIATDVKESTCGAYNTFFIKNDGSLWGSGYNESNNLGNGTYNNASVPIQIATNAQKVVASFYHTLIIKKDGSLWACGNNDQGQLGDGTITNPPTFKQIYASGIKDVAAGADFSLILKSDNTLWTCGSNTYGNLGNGTNTNSIMPAQIMSNVKSISVGSWHALVVKNDGTLWAFGQNGFGQLGNGTYNDANTPQLILTGVKSSACGQYHSLVLKQDNTLWGFGNNGQGQLANDQNISTSPVPLLIKY